MKIDCAIPLMSSYGKDGVSEEKRIFVIVNRYVEIEHPETPELDPERVFMSDGRMAAQACHVTGKYRAERKRMAQRAAFPHISAADPSQL